MKPKIRKAVAFTLGLPHAQVPAPPPSRIQSSTRIARGKERERERESKRIPRLTAIGSQHTSILLLPCLQCSMRPCTPSSLSPNPRWRSR